MPQPDTGVLHDGPRNYVVRNWICETRLTLTYSRVARSFQNLIDMALAMRAEPQAYLVPCNLAKALARKMLVHWASCMREWQQRREVRQLEQSIAA